MIRTSPLTNWNPALDRRELLAGLGAAALTPAVFAHAAAPARLTLELWATTGTINLGPGHTETQIWSLQGMPRDFRPSRGDELEIHLRNELPVSVLLYSHGIDGAAVAEPLIVRSPLAPGASESLAVQLRHAGTFLLSLGTLGDGSVRPCRPLALVVPESQSDKVDRDEVFLIEDWRLPADGTAIVPGGDPGAAAPIYTVNGRIMPDILARSHERLRFRFINFSQRNVIAVKIDELNVQAVALDSQPVEPFLARNGALVLAPGGRADALVDATARPGSTSFILLHDGKTSRPIARLATSSEQPIREVPLPPAPALPSNGLPARLELKGALRFELALGPQADWVAPADFIATAPPAFRAKAGRTVVLALTNRGEIANVFRLHGHHFRLLDRLDDGWKPFWLDTLAVEPGQTQRIAFAAQYSGRWLIESVATDWAAPARVRWYSVE